MTAKERSTSLNGKFIDWIQELGELPHDLEEFS